MAYDWSQNNVRELRNIIERMVIAADGDLIGLEHVPQEIRDAGAPPSSSTVATGQTFLEQKAEAERRIIALALARNDWHITRTATELGLDCVVAVSNEDELELAVVLKKPGKWFSPDEAICGVALPNSDDVVANEVVVNDHTS